jgi:tetratricopeptide (TPR) repeat protein
MKLIALLLLIVACLGIYWLQSAIDRQMGCIHHNEEALYWPSGKVLKALSLGHYGLIADIYWMRAVQYYGGKRLQNAREFKLLEPLIDIATTLDPQLLHAYRFGSIFLSEKSPIGAQQPEKAITLLEKGIRYNPNEWQLYRDLGFVYYWYLEDYKKAAEWFLEGSKNPKSARWMKTFAAELLAKGNSRETAKFLWQEVYDTSDSGPLKNNAKENLLRLQALDEIDILKSVVSKVEAKTGRKVSSMQELVQLGLFKQLPLDPKGIPYALNPETGEIGLSSESTVKRY